MIEKRRPDDLVRQLIDHAVAAPAVAHQILHQLQKQERPFLLHTDVYDAFAEVCTAPDAPADLAVSAWAKLFRCTQEAVINGSWIYLAVRLAIGQWRYLRIAFAGLRIEEIDVRDFLHFKEMLATGQHGIDEWLTEIDFGPFYHESPKMQEARSIGRGVEFLNRQLSGQLFGDLRDGKERIVNFLNMHAYRGQQLMLNEQIGRVRELQRALADAEEFLAPLNPELSWTDVASALRALGFEPGWGRQVARIRDTMSLLRDLLEAPDPRIMETFLARLPMIFSVAIVSPHGYFGQADVLGRPDTGGQVVYILDQVRALETEMRSRLYEQGLDIEPQIIVLTRLIPQAEGSTCDQPLEPILGTRAARILRVPFRNPSGEIK